MVIGGTSLRKKARAAFYVCGGRLVAPAGIVRRNVGADMPSPPALSMNQWRAFAVYFVHSRLHAADVSHKFNPAIASTFIVIAPGAVVIAPGAVVVAPNTIVVAPNAVVVAPNTAGAANSDACRRHAHHDCPKILGSSLRPRSVSRPRRQTAAMPRVSQQVTPSEIILLSELSLRNCRQTLLRRPRAIHPHRHRRRLPQNAMFVRALSTK
ncbi:hypothetical protein R3P38DRAFT_3179276 [Favolaschia claudopus]|uniref:Uncharacterized protein n=1 Tax=Favolaschia claudopus TaxID=2862362 RepID=A0AAW0CUK5_9AGAR